MYNLPLIDYLCGHGIPVESNRVWKRFCIRKRLHWLFSSDKEDYCFIE